jgi:tetratricopeptide (TPR) repeat protein
MNNKEKPLDGALRLERAKELLDSGKPADALALLRRPAPRAFSVEHDYLRAEALRAQGFLAKAAAIHRRLLLRPVAEDPSAWLDCSLSLVACLRSLGDTAQARRVWSQARRHAGLHPDPEIMRRLDLEGLLISRAAGDFQRSIAGLRKHLDRFLAERDRCGAAYTLWAIGGAQRFMGDLSASRKSFLRSLDLARRARDSAGIGYALFGLGGVTRIQGDLTSARRYYAAALRAVAGTEDIFGRAYAHCGLANVLRQSGKLAQAHRHYLRAHELYRSLEDPVDLAYVDWGLGQIHLHRGELRLALARVKQAWTGFQSGREDRGLVLCQMSQAAILHAQGRTEEAEKVFDAGVRRARQAGIHTHLEIFT